VTFQVRRKDWFNGQLDLHLERLILIDETGVTTRMARLRGWSAKTEQRRAPIPHRHYQNHHIQGGFKAVGATLLYLSSYNFDFNPIRMAFSKLRARLPNGLRTGAPRPSYGTP